MERDEAFRLVRTQLTEKRYIHTLGVADTAVELAGRFGADPKKAELAAAFHDYAKYRPLDEMKEVIRSHHLPDLLLEFDPELWHAPVGAILVEREAGIHDREILDAIRFHTTGRPGMTVLEKIIFLADYIEPNRSFPGVEEVRQLAKKSLDRAVLRALQNTIIYLAAGGRRIYPDTLDTYNDFVLRIGNQPTNDHREGTGRQ
jgi:conserved hypothetical protein TIGR00488